MYVKVMVVGDDTSVAKCLAVDNASFAGVGMVGGVMEE